MNRRWQQQAKCLHPSVGPADFSPTDDRGRVDVTKAQKVADEFCRGCPVRLDCLAAAATNGAQEIVQGGMWWPANPYHSTHIRPLDLLDEPATEDAAA